MKYIIGLLLLLSLTNTFAQSEGARLSKIKTQLEIIAIDNAGFTEEVKTEVSITRISLANFLLALSELHKININVSPELEQIQIANNFSNVIVSDLLTFLCKEHSLTIDFTGNILSIKQYDEPVIENDNSKVEYDPTSNTITIDAKQKPLYDMFRRIMEESGKNLVFTPGMESIPITSYFKNIPFDIAMDKMALANNLFQTRTKDDFYVFQRPISNDETNVILKPLRPRSSNLNFKIIDHNGKLLEVDFVNEPIANIINDLSEELKLNVFTSSPLEKAGTATLRAKSIHFDDLLTKIFESQIVEANTARVSGNNRNNNSNQNNTTNKKLFSFKKDGDVYFFGTEDQLSLRKVSVIFFKHRSVELLSDPQGSMYGNKASNSVYNNLNAVNDNYSSLNNNLNSNRNQNQRNSNTPELNENDDNSSLLSIIPEELLQDLEVKVDYELNSFYVNGPSTKVDKLIKFIEEIDKPVPVILIEVMIIEVNKNSLIDTGVSWGIGDEPAITKGSIYPETNLTLGANTVNKVLGSFSDFSGFNLGKVGANFFASISAMESNGDLKIRSTPRLATLNSHRATFSNGQTSFYAVTRRNIYGTNNPQTSEITNYLPIEAELGLTIKPSVSGNGQVLLDISVIQSSFGNRIAEDAPPDVNSRSFSSLIRMQDGDIAVLGGLEEQLKSNKGSGVPFLARIPVIKYLFSKRKREAKKAKLTVLIKPTVIN